MEVGEVELAEIEGLVVRLMGHATMARAYGEAIRRDPTLAGGFGKLAERHRAAVKTLSAEIQATAAAHMEVGAVVSPLRVVSGPGR